MKFAVVHGDITSDYATTQENVVSKVGALIEKIKSKYGYEWEHFIKIIHIADTDGAFTKNCIKQAEVEKIQQLLKDKNTEGLIKLDQSAVLPANECIRDAIKKLGVFHSSKPLKFLKSGELGVGSLKILYFYHNRLDNYDFLTTN